MGQSTPLRSAISKEETRSYILEMARGLADLAERAGHADLFMLLSRLLTVDGERRMLISWARLCN